MFSVHGVSGGSKNILERIVHNSVNDVVST